MPTRTLVNKIIDPLLSTSNKLLFDPNLFINNTEGIYDGRKARYNNEAAEESIKSDFYIKTGILTTLTLIFILFLSLNHPFESRPSTKTPDGKEIKKSQNEADRELMTFRAPKS
jgi:hypothetical protein